MLSAVDIDEGYSIWGIVYSEWFLLKFWGYCERVFYILASNSKIQSLTPIYKLFTLVFLFWKKIILTSNLHQMNNTLTYTKI